MPVKPFRDVTAQDVLHGLRQQDAKPRQVVPLSSLRLPMAFKQLPEQRVGNTFPFDAGFAVPLYVAQERGVDLRSVDFVLGGSALNVLASRKIDRNNSCEAMRYLVQKCPVTGVTVLAKSAVYSTDYGSKGFQFERLLTGRDLDDDLDRRHFESLQLIKVAGFTVLFAAEVDAVDIFGMPVELRSSRMRCRQRTMKTMFQMMSSGTETLVQAGRIGPVLTDVSASSLDDVVGMLAAESLAAAAGSIAEALRALKRSDIATDVPTELDFEAGALVLKPCPDGDLLPSESVVKELMLGPMTSGGSTLRRGPRLNQAQALEALRKRMERIALGRAAASGAKEAGALGLKRQVAAAEASNAETEWTYVMALVVGLCLGAGGATKAARSMFHLRGRSRAGAACEGKEDPLLAL
jgi:hypothetical protein